MSYSFIANFNFLIQHSISPVGIRRDGEIFAAKLIRPSCTRKISTDLEREKIALLFKLHLNAVESCPGVYLWFATKQANDLPVELNGVDVMLEKAARVVLEPVGDFHPGQLPFDHGLGVAGGSNVLKQCPSSRLIGKGIRHGRIGFLPIVVSCLLDFRGRALQEPFLCRSSVEFRCSRRRGLATRLRRKQVAPSRGGRALLPRCRHASTAGARRSVQLVGKARSHSTGSGGADLLHIFRSNLHTRGSFNSKLSMHRGL
mmetsp:Transcript_5491/g.11967  ORF Transcript_5491/g.11967 Transcript_5491/m.11967 type:complete len:258 (+) Transcript_5491:82-855(+)